jgi:predicted RNase H-like nuclease (RuvC/YqgF family)
MNGGEKEMVELNREVAELKTMMTMVLQSVRDLQSDLRSSYVTKSEYEELKRRIDKLEAAPHRWIATAIALVSIIVVFFKP